MHPVLWQVDFLLTQIRGKAVAVSFLSPIQQSPSFETRLRKEDCSHQAEGCKSTPMRPYIGQWRIWTWRSSDIDSSPSSIETYTGHLFAKLQFLNSVSRLYQSELTTLWISYSLLLTPNTMIEPWTAMMNTSMEDRLDHFTHGDSEQRGKSLDIFLDLRPAE